MPNRTANHRPIGAAKVSVPPEDATPQVRTLHDCVLALLDGAIETVRAGHGDEAVHAVRKSCKTVRAALRLLRERFGTLEYRRQNRRVRDAAKPLTAVRDALVLRELLARLPAPPPLVGRRLDSEYRRQRQILERRGFRTALGKLIATRESLVQLSLDGPEGMSALAGALREYRAGRKALNRARSRDDQALHEWRKQAKYLLNQLDLLGLVFNTQFKKLRRRANRLTKALGDDHDLSMLMSELGRPAASDGGAIKHLKRRRRKLQRRAFRTGKRLFGRPPKHIKAMMAAPLAKPNRQTCMQ
ncbi:MAG TPA: CHAD domain-containing protein [Steroidobacteraceae bacterium]|jgi:CHAD domain-containing protein|nr:CHAD domain-containing protein [Steroidobacteraceae bacterium]